MLFVRMRLRCPSGNFIQQVGGRLLDVLAQAVGGRLQPPGLHIGRDGVRLVQRGLAWIPWRTGLQGRRRPFAVAGRHLGEHVAYEVHHAPLVLRLGQHRADRGDEPGASVADHETNALQAAFDHAAKELLPAVPVLLHALGHADGLAMPLRVDSDGGQDADVLHVPAP